MGGDESIWGMTGFTCFGAGGAGLDVLDDRLDRRGGRGKGNEDVGDKAVVLGVVGSGDGAICRAPSVRTPDDLPVSGMELRRGDPGSD